MARQYDHKKIEKKWQKKWASSGVYSSKEKGKKKYVLDMFPYPSGEGLHVGHPKGYIATDVYSRHARMQGYSVLHPMGWDAFGLPAENYAIKNKVHPRKAVEKNIKRFKEQLQMIGLDYDWKREINTTDPGYYKWTQWIFLQLLKHGLAYQSFEPINWCPSCQTGLANEDLEGNQCERCGSVVEKRPMRQWVLKITDYAERLLKDLDLLPAWQEHIKESQRNWIGKSEGAQIDFPLEFQNENSPKPNFLILHGYTGRADKIFIPWLKRELESRGFDVQAPQMPNTDHPKEDEQVGHVLQNCKVDEHTIIVGHSLGAAIAMKVVERIRRPIAGLVLVAPVREPEFYVREKNPFLKAFRWSYDHALIKKYTGFRVILSDTLEKGKRGKYIEHLSGTISAPIQETSALREHFTATREPFILVNLLPHIRVFTTRADTLFGATYLVLAPEHPWVALALKHKTVLTNNNEVQKYVVQAGKKTELERMADQKEKTGVWLEGVEAVNPATREKIPLYVADYVLSHYGTGAIMAVPAHDERDFAFAEKFKLPIKQVIAKVLLGSNEGDKARPDAPFKERNAVMCIVKHWEHEEYLCLQWNDFPEIRTFPSGGIEGEEDPVDAGTREILEETGYINARFVRQVGDVRYIEFYHQMKKTNLRARVRYLYFELENDAQESISDKEQKKHSYFWKKKGEVLDFLSLAERSDIWRRFLVNKAETYTGEGRLVNSGEFDGLTSEEARKGITEQYGVEKTTYKIRDWVFSRQRYWGEPIPVIHCEKCGVVPVPEKDLPVKLPDVKKYAPTGTGESPLASIPTWVNVKCPKCKGKAKRETNTMPQWAGSSWYYLRYMDPKNKKTLVGTKKEKYWAPVDMYVGGAEHATRHLIYARFWHKFLHDIKVVSTLEPFMRLISVGLIQAEDGRKMSKRFGNVINPDTIVHTYGADTLRVYEMFMGPFTDAISWNTNSMIGSRRFLERVWRLQERVQTKDNPALDAVLHKTIQKVGEDIEAFKFNTAISQMMILVNAIYDSAIGKKQWGVFLKLLAPFAPHMTEELWALQGNKKSIHIEKWPGYDAKKTLTDVVTISVQVNGKVRTQITVSSDAAEETVRAEAEKAAAAWISSASSIVRVIVVPKRIVNIVTR